MEFKNVELRTRFRLPLRWVMVLLLGFIVQNTFAVETHILNGKVFTRFNNALVQAANKAVSESLCGFNDWREPTKEELLTLIDPVNVPSSIAFNESYFPNTGAHFYWTSESDLDGNGKVIDFGSGIEYIILYEDEYDYKFRKRLVRGGAMAMPNNH